MFGSMSEGCFVAKQEADSRVNFGLEMLNVSLEGEFTYSKLETSRVVMLDGRAGAGSDWLKSMHLVLLAFKSSWRPRKESCRDLKLVWRLVKTQCPKRGQKYTEWCRLRRGVPENHEQQEQHH